jgi:hypothetical protein
MATFCLLHGNWHDGSCWQPLIEALEARGHEAVAPDLPFDDPETTYADRIRPALQALETSCSSCRARCLRPFPFVVARWRLDCVRVERPSGLPGHLGDARRRSQRRQLVRSGASPAWSPDGTRIAFHAPRAQIEFVSPNGTLLSARPPFRPGTSVGINAPPVWSPDGKKIAMSSRPYGTYVMNADGTDVRRLTPRAVGVSLGQPPRPAWRPVVARQ